MKRAAKMSLLIGGACTATLILLLVWLGGVVGITDIVANWPRSAASTRNDWWVSLAIVWFVFAMLRSDSVAPNIDSMRSSVERELQRVTERIGKLANDIRDTGDFRDRVALAILSGMLRDPDRTISNRTISISQLATEAYAKAEVVMRIRRDRS